MFLYSRASLDPWPYIWRWLINSRFWDYFKHSLTLFHIALKCKHKDSGTLWHFNNFQNINIFLNAIHVNNVYCVNSVKGIVRYFKKFEILQKLQSIVKVPILTVSSRYLCGHTKEYKSVSAARFGLPPKPSDMPTLP